LIPFEDVELNGFQPADTHQVVGNSMAATRVSSAPVPKMPLVAISYSSWSGHFIHAFALMTTYRRERV
jgi:hypothetical protein